MRCSYLVRFDVSSLQIYWKQLICWCCSSTFRTSNLRNTYSTKHDLVAAYILCWLQNTKNIAQNSKEQNEGKIVYKQRVLLEITYQNVRFIYQYLRFFRQ